MYEFKAWHELARVLIVTVIVVLFTVLANFDLQAVIGDPWPWFLGLASGAIQAMAAAGLAVLTGGRLTAPKLRGVTAAGGQRRAGKRPSGKG